MKHDQGLLHNLVGVFMGSLDLNLDTVLQGMGLPVAGKLHVFVFEEVDANEVTDSVVFEGDAVGDTVDHFLTLHNIDSLFG